MVRHRRQAFTLIELLVVIGIILLLIGISVIGFQHIDKATSEKATHTRLDACSSILNEYEASAGSINSIEGAGPAANPPSIYFSVAMGGTSGQMQNPGDVNLGSGGRANVAVTNTGLVLQACARVPACKTILAQMPASALLAGSTPTNPQVVDAWNNPIIYVPASGLPGVTTGGRVLTAISVDGRPFWASAGQDGNFSNGDDNIYSTAVSYK